MCLKKLFPILFLLLTFNFYGQNDKSKDDNFKEKREQIKAMKVAFLTTELDLTSSEAEKFWPIYNTFDDKQFELRHQKMKGIFKRMQDSELDKMSEKEAAALLNQIQDNEEDLFNLRKKFISNLKGILPSVKIIKFKKAEEDFGRKLLQQYKDKGAKK
ncbi:sensor of ECF-type sigma factor [Flavobacterium gilvum]|uniref:Sensor of ECF-type sigma factor n=2 Tax=Flavobacterium gilvum TaxID=1492737 RepID=A0AAC9I6C5_9FLAO|nr:sensor of ECF-type sigma factor [Flavobacterium gilvum]